MDSLFETRNYRSWAQMYYNYTVLSKHFCHVLTRLCSKSCNRESNYIYMQELKFFLLPKTRDSCMWHLGTVLMYQSPFLITSSLLL